MTNIEIYRKRITALIFMSATPILAVSPYLIALLGSAVTPGCTNEANCGWAALPWFMLLTIPAGAVFFIIGLVTFLATLAIAWPSSILIFFLQKIILGIKDPIKKKSIQYAAAALAIGLVLSSAWQIAIQINHGVAAFALTFATIAITVFTRWHPLYLIAIGGVLGVLGFI